MSCSEGADNSLDLSLDEGCGKDDCTALSQGPTIIWDRTMQKFDSLMPLSPSTRLSLDRLVHLFMDAGVGKILYLSVMEDPDDVWQPGDL